MDGSSILSRRDVLRTTGLAAATAVGVGRSESSSVRAGAVAPDSPPEKSWAKVYGSREHKFHELTAVAEAENGDYILTGQAAVDKNHFSEVWLVRVAPDGTQRWAKTFGTDEYHEMGQDIVVDQEGAFVIAGFRWPPRGGQWDGFVARISAEGELLWRNTFGNDSPAEFRSIAQTADGDLVAAGGINKQQNGPQGWIIKFDLEGNRVWEWANDGSRQTYLYSISGDSGIVGCGYVSAGSDSRATDTWLVKLDKTSREEWTREIQDKKRNIARDITATSDDGYVIGGRRTELREDGFDIPISSIIKIDSEGAVQWSQTHDFGSLEEYARSVVETRDGGFLLLSEANKNAGGEGNIVLWLTKVGPNGQKQWEQTYSRTPTDYPRSLIETSDGDYLLGGVTYEHGPNGRPGRRDGWVVKLGVNDPPEAAFSVSNDPMVGRPVQFSAADSTDPDGTIGAYKWDFTGDGSVDARGKTARYTYSKPGQYPVTLTVVDKDGKRARTRQSVTVSATPTPSPTPSSTPSGTATATGTAHASDSDGAVLPLVGAGAGTLTLAGALAWWRRRGDD